MPSGPIATDLLAAYAATDPPVLADLLMDGDTSSSRQSSPSLRSFPIGPGSFHRLTAEVEIGHCGTDESDD